MNEHATTTALDQRSITEIAHPELSAVPDPDIRAGLFAGFGAAAEDLAAIEHCFRTVTADEGSVEQRRTFFRSWNMTNNSAMCVAGQTNRLSALAVDAETDTVARSLLGAIAALDRITDEDLAVGSGVLHADLFYRMATHHCGGDEWLGHRYMVPEAADFKRSRDRASLHQPDIMPGLLITLVHEIYTHSEVEFILPLFEEWSVRHFGREGRRRASELAWIRVHCNGTETRHFGHALDAVRRYCEVTDQRVTAAAVETTARDYLAGKAACMRAITARYA